MISLNNILVATDFGEQAQVALQHGVELAKRFGARLHVLHVVDDVAAHPYTEPLALDFGRLQTEQEDEARANLQTILPEPDRSATRAEVNIAVSASPAQAILSYARDRQIDLIVVGTHGRTGLARLLLGSVARDVSGAADCPVLTVREHQRSFIRPDADRPAAAICAV